MYRLKETQIVCNSLVLRPFTIHDSTKVFAMGLEAGIKTWMPDQVYADEKEAKEVLQFLIGQYKDEVNPAEVPLVFGVVLRHSNELIGHVGLSPLNGKVEVGYAIENCQQGRGYASEAVEEYTDWALHNFRLQEILGIVAKENLASARVLEKSGFEFQEEKMGTMHGCPKLQRIYRKTIA